ncbi:DUF6216 family protein [Chromobacterium haemolyticum]|uniref:DUF6216 family protein n=1 Tax=Chromobacterium haemolyticum TaxID=394935 RepID=UPI0024481CFF|nr:DUF6216 family protein [Chromobacterium haemolyticum]MDH0342409.1 DUF6216 family protein [Chromobacterium haemolyticum]
MEYIDYVNQASKLISPLTAIFLGTLPVLAILFVVLRTQSYHIPLTLLWRIVGGKKEINDKLLADFLDERNAIMKFRTLTGLKIRTKQEMLALIQWAAKHNEDIDDVKRCGHYFKLSEPGNITSPNRFGSIALLLAVLALGILTASGVASTGIDDGLYATTESKTWFFASSQKTITGLWGKNKISESDCAKPTLPATGFAPGDAQIFCKFFKQTNYPKAISDTVSKQRMLLLFLSAYTGFFLFLTVQPLRRCVSAKEMIRRQKALQAKQEERGQLTTEPLPTTAEMTAPLPANHTQAAPAASE